MSCRHNGIIYREWAPGAFVSRIPLTLIMTPSPGEDLSISSLSMNFYAYRYLTDMFLCTSLRLSTFQNFTCQAASLIGDFNNWNPNADVMKKVGMRRGLQIDFLKCVAIWRVSSDFAFFVMVLQDEFGVWEVFLPDNADGTPAIPHGSRVKVRLP